MCGLMEDDYDLDEEKLAVSDLLARREVPSKDDDNLLIETWNIENLGSKGSRKRRLKDHQLIAELIRPFDLIAIQELKSDLWGIREVMQALGEPYRVVFTDVGGNTERLAYIFHSSRVELREQFAELAIPESEEDEYDPPDINRKFKGFNRNPYLVSFKRIGRDDFNLTLANVHIYFGKASGVEYLGRLVEVYALARWAYGEVRTKSAYDQNIVLLGDMNVPKMHESDAVYRQLTRFGYEPTNWSTKVGTNLDGTEHFDQIAIYPKKSRQPTEYGVLNFDKHLFKSVWDKNGLDPDSEQDLSKWRRYCEMRVSDHRPLWAEFSA